MKMYVKPSINVIELQLKENIAAVPTTVYKGATSSQMQTTASRAYSIALSSEGTGMSYDGTYMAS